METSSPFQNMPRQTNISAQTGGNINAPVLSGNHFQGQVVFNLHAALESLQVNTSQAGISTDIVLTDELICQCKQNHKFKLGKKFQKINEGISQHGNSFLLNEIYTELYITEGGGGEVNKEHEVRQIETASRRPTAPEMPINCSDLFKDKAIRTVLTKGIAGIGKTVSVQKFILDWAEGKANWDVIFIFPLAFRELNLMREKMFSLTDIVHCFFQQMIPLTTIHSEALKVIFIFDGLDECRLPLDFQNNESLFDVSQPAPVDVLLTNLIKGNLLPSALIWITTRPAAANQIPPECVDQVTEVRGFSDPQKEEYFTKRISDQSVANRIISHIKSSRSLYIMCHIPVFCWIAATVLEKILSEAEGGDIPKTLTQMFTCFLIFQTKKGSRKYHGKCDIDPHQARDIVLALGKLAYQQLEKGNLIFYEADLRECGIDVREVSVYSEVYTQIFTEESDLDRVFTFVHLSIQEFLAALYVYLVFHIKNINVLKQKPKTTLNSLFRKSNMTNLFKSAVDKALQSENGHLDLFLRFLLGLSEESSQTLFRGLQTPTLSSSHSKKDIVKYLKEKIRENPSPEKSINLFHCLNELNDHSLVEEVQAFLGRRSADCLHGAKLSPAQWSALVFVLLNSEAELDVFDLSKYERSDECLIRLLPVVKTSRKAILSYCKLTEKSCAVLASALSSNSSTLREVNLNDNNLQDSGIKLLSAGLESPNCKLEILSLELCRITNESCAALTSALMSNPSYLRELNLNYNKPGDSGVKLLSTVLRDPRCKLEKLQLESCSITEEGCAALVSALISNPSHMRQLNLNWNKIGHSEINFISALLGDPQCNLESLQLECCSIREEDCVALASALTSNPSSNLKELILNYNKPGDLGVKQFSALIENPHCALETLQLLDPSHIQNLNLSHIEPGDSGVVLLSSVLGEPDCKLEKLLLQQCNVTEKGCAILASVLSSSLSNLIELNLSNNKISDSGVKLLSAGLESPHCKLELLSLRECNLTAESCAVLASVFSKPSSLINLQLSDNDLQDSGVKLLSAGLKNPLCNLETLGIQSCNLTHKSCAVLASVVSSDCSLLRIVNLSSNKLQDSGVKLLNPYHKLKILGLFDCSLTDQSCALLASVLSSKSSCLTKLNLIGNEFGDSAVKLLSAGLGSPNCKLETLKLGCCTITKEGCAALVSALKSHPSSHLRDFSLCLSDLGDSGVKQLSALLQDLHCTLEKLQLFCCNLTQKSCATLFLTLSSNTSTLKILDLSNNDLRDSGVKLLSAGLQSPHCKLEALWIWRCNLTDESCSVLAPVLSSTSSSLRHLDLSNNNLHDSGVKQLSAGLENPHCKLEILILDHCMITDEGFAALASALKNNPSSRLKQLRLNYNKLGHSVLRQLSALLHNPHCALEILEVRPYRT